jgi:hypothetical protein
LFESFWVCLGIKPFFGNHLKIKLFSSGIRKRRRGLLQEEKKKKRPSSG